MSTLDQVIKKLQDMKKESGGDIEVFVFGDDGGETYTDVSQFTVEEQDNGYPKRNVIQG